MPLSLDYNPTNGAFILRVPRDSGVSAREIMLDSGFDYSTTASTAGEAVLFTKEPYAAVGFWQYATPRAQQQLIVLQTEIAASRQKEGTGHIDCPPDEQLVPFQIAGVQYALRRQNTLVGDVPGLGKTPQAICFANEIRAKTVLVVVPANIRLQWCKMIRRWSTMPYPYVVYPVMNGRNGVHPTSAWTVISYDMTRSKAIHAALMRRRYDLMIIDEMHYLKEYEAQRTKAVLGSKSDGAALALAGQCGAILGLTGTPLPNRPREAYTAIRGLCWDAIDFMSEDSFNERFNPVLRRETPEGKVFTDERTGRHGELQARMRTNFMVRREKHGAEGVGYQLNIAHIPNYDIIQVEETGEIKKALAAERMLDLDPEELEGVDATCLGAIATVRRMMGVAMAPLAAEYIDMVMRGGEEKVVIFAHHHEVLDILEKELRKWGVLRIDGKLSSNQKQARVDQFVADPRIGCLIGNMQSMGTGTDGLQAVAWHAIFAEPDWVPGTNQQAVDRLDRGGQNIRVQADFLVAPNSFAEKVLGSSLRKLIVTNKALDKVW